MYRNLFKYMNINTVCAAANVRYYFIINSRSKYESLRFQV